MTAPGFHNRPRLPLTAESATLNGLRAANDLTIRTLIDLLSNPDRKHEFQKILYCAQKCPGGTLENEFTLLYGEHQASKMTNPDALAYRYLRRSFVDRISEIQKTYRALVP